MGKYLVFIFILLGSAVHAQHLRVLDDETREPLSYASLSSGDNSIKRTCNEYGEVDISVFSECKRVKVLMLGYQTLTITTKELFAAEHIFLHKQSYDLNTVVVSSVRRPQTADKVPAKIKNISAEDVFFNAPQTSADLLTLSDQVFIQKSQQGGGSPMIRGFAANRLLYTVDGVRMNTAIYRSGNLQNVISLDALAMEGVEVLLGGGSVIYGSDAIGGVMAFNTKTPDLISQKYVEAMMYAGAASVNRSSIGHLDVSYGNDRFSAITSYSYNSYGNLKMGKNGPDDYLQNSLVLRQNNQDVEIINDDPLLQNPVGYAQHNFMQKFRYKASDNMDLIYAFHYSETSDYSRYDRLLRRKNGQPRYGEWRYGPQVWMMNHLNIKYTSEHKLMDQLEVKLAHQHNEESRISRAFNADTRELREEMVDAFSVNLDLSKNIGTHRLFYGAEGLWNDVNSEGINEDIITPQRQAGPSRYPQALWTSYAFYLYDQLYVTQKSNLSMGLRYNHYHIDADFDTTFYPLPYDNARLNNQAVTANLGYNLRPDASSLLRINLSTAFRAPNVDDMGKVFDSEPGNVIIPNADLKAEYAYNAELGVAKVFHKIIKTEASIYYTYLNNALVRRDFSLNGQDSMMYDGEMSKVQAVQNAAHAYVYGFNLGVDVELPLHLYFKGDYNWQKGEEELENGQMSPARHVAPAFMRAAFAYRYKQLRAELKAIYTIERSYNDLADSEKDKAYIYALDANGNPYSPAWHNLSFSVNYTFYKNYTLGLGLDNITNQRYRPYSSGIAAPGRSFRFSFQLNL